MQQYEGSVKTMLIDHTFYDTITMFGVGHYKNEDRPHFDPVDDYTPAERKMVDKIKKSEGIDDTCITRLKFPKPSDGEKETVKIDAGEIRVICSLPKGMPNWRRQTIKPWYNFVSMCTCGQRNMQQNVLVR